MPCRDWEGHDDNSDYYLRDLHAAQRKNDQLAQMLCALCGKLEGTVAKGLIASTPGLERWWKAHKKADELRRVEEKRKADEAARKQRIKQQALGKLTPEERRELGL